MRLILGVRCRRSGAPNALITEFNKRERCYGVYCRAGITSVVILMPRVIGDLEMGDAGKVSVVLRSVVTAAIKSVFYGKLYAGPC